MTWDVTVPADTDLIRLGAGVIRQEKIDLTTALTAEGIFPGANPAAPVFRWTGLRGGTAARPASPILNELYFNTDIPQFEYWNGSAWTMIDCIPNNSLLSGKLNPNIAGAGIGGGAGVPLFVQVDNATLDVNGSNDVEIKAQGVAAAQIATSAIGSGLTGGGGSAVSVVTDGASIDVNGSNQVEVKASGITESKIAASALSAAGALTGGGGTKLAVAVDGSTIQIAGDQLIGVPGALGLKSIQTKTVNVNFVTSDQTVTVNTTIASVNAAKAVPILTSLTFGVQTDNIFPQYTISLTSPTNLRIVASISFLASGTDNYVFIVTVLELN